MCAFGKIWLVPGIEVVYLQGFNTSEQKQIKEIVTEHADDFKQKWNEYFSWF
ncbi:MAG: DUF4160 domain-containing protein [Flavipsychrobacter sp.]|nr:DUF4160 domain-containing protein [Flavipsychrobacter sp.]